MNWFTNLFTNKAKEKKKTVTSPIPDEETHHFQVIEGFQCEVAGHVNFYYGGGIYHVRPGNKILLDKALEWEKEGRIQWLPSTPGTQTAIIAAAGKVY